jgi:hypothetical protein
MSNPNLPPLPKPYDLIVVLIEGGELSEVPVWDADQMRAYGEACVAADCRLCANFTTKSGGCVSLVQCVDGSQYKATTPRQYWLAGTTGGET